MSCWSLVSFYFFRIKGHVYPNPARRSLCLSSSETASMSLARMWWETRPKAIQYTPRGNKADATAWWHSLLCIVSFYQSSAFHLCGTRRSDAKCQACWPSSVEREVLRVKKASWWNLPVRRRLTAPALQMGVERHPYYSVFRQTWKQMWLDIPACPLLLLLLLLIMPGVLFRLSCSLLL